MDELRRVSEAIHILHMDLSDLHSVRNAAHEFLRSVFSCVFIEDEINNRVDCLEGERGAFMHSSITRESVV